MLPLLSTIDPINEFTSNDTLFYGAFPTAFPMGYGLRKPGSIPQADALHMLTQHSGKFKHDANLIFMVFNQGQRHAVAQSLAAKVKSSPVNFSAFSNIVNAPGFQKRCDTAAQELNGTVARRLL